MSLIFLSHVEKDLTIMQQIAHGLEHAGYTTWYFERDVLPGTSYLIQITQAIEQCDAIVLIVSPNALGSHQVTMEVVGAFERNKPFFPVLVDITPPELKQHQPEWRHALGGTAMIMANMDDFPMTLAAVIDGLKSRNIPTEACVPSPPTPQRIPPSQSETYGERKNVTVMFADISGFYAMSERMDPEAVADIMNECFCFMGECIEHHGGKIDKFIGDCVMALFGAPKTLEDAPQRAIETALEMKNRLVRFSEDKHLPIPLSFHIGINTGPVISGMVGSDSRQDFTVLGETVNLASRMADTAETGTILVADNTYRLAEGYFDFESIGEVKVKGKEQPVKAYKVLGPRHVITRIAASLDKGLTPFHGRAREMALLKDCYEKVRDGQGQVVGVMGEPGMGKTRLIREFTLSLPPEGYTYLEGGCLHFGDVIPYLPILDILKYYFDIKEDDDGAAIKQKIDIKIKQIKDIPVSILSPLHEILSLRVEDEAYAKLDGKQRRDRVFEAIRFLLIAESQSKSLVVVVEDLHWMDKTSEEFLTYLMGSIPTSRLMLILLYRLEYTHPWVNKTYYSQIRVDQLPRNVSTDLVQAILDDGEVDEEINDLIVEKTSGNPLFIEELSHSLVENGSIVKEGNRYVLCCIPSDIRIPDTIQGIIAARLDRLETNLKKIMQTASVIGREFAFRILQAMAMLKDDLKTSLIVLQDLEFIYEKNVFPELEYIFKHALTQEVAYNSLLIKKRKETHKRVAQAIEEIYYDRLEEFYEMLAYHYSMSEDNSKAYQYLRLSADKAARNYANLEAIQFYREALRMLDDRTEDDANKREKMQLLLLFQVPLFLLGFPDGSFEILQRSEMIAQELDDMEALASFHRSLSLYHTFKEDISLGVQYAERCFNEAERIEDVGLMTQSADQLCFSYYMQGEAFKSVDVSQRALELFETHKLDKSLTTGGLNVYSALCGWHGIALSTLGRFEEAKTALDKGISNAHEVNDWFEIGLGEASYALLSLYEGDSNGTIAHAREAIRFFEKGEIGIALGYTWSLLGTGYCLQGEYETAINHAEKGCSLQKEIGMNLFVAVSNWFLSFVLFSAGDLARAREYAEDALKIAHEIKSRYIEAIAYEALGFIAGKEDPTHIDEARHSIQQGISIMEELNLIPVFAREYLLLGELFTDAGYQQEALENLKKAKALFHQMGVNPRFYWPARIQKALAKIGQSSEA